ncbi:MAG: ABC transporter permease subunit [Planctomycetales bacterium]|nr:ABC transporter permease subunit [Planctomycetales bacterium]
MRPYLAVISDSFRAALASRVLWVLLAVITLCLACLAPLGARRVLSSELKLFDFLHPLGLSRQLYQEFESRQPSPGRRIFHLLDPATQKLFRDTMRGASPDWDELGPLLRELLNNLNELLDRRDFYDQPSWQNVTLSEEAQQLLARGVANLPDTELRRLNRLLLEAAYRDLIAVSPPTSLQLQYAGLNVNGPLPISHERFQRVLRQILGLATYYLIGVAAVLVAILVTAPVIPHMMEKGTIELLLSKPVSRIPLFLASFIGSCAFILLNASYLVGGLWLIAGLRFDIWEPKLLLCIPLLLFRFVIYYAVSAFIGLIWRSPVVAVIVTILFWAVCLGVEQTKVRIENAWIAPRRIANIFTTPNGTWVARDDNSVWQWNADRQQWEEIARGKQQRSVLGRMLGFSERPMLGPLYHPQSQLLLSANLPAREEAGSSAGAFLQAAAQRNQWQRVAVAELPAGTRWLSPDAQGDMIALARDGVYRLGQDKIRVQDRHPDDRFFVDLPKFQQVYSAAEDTSWTPRAAALDPRSSRLAVWLGEELAVLEPRQGEGYQLKQRRPLDDPPTAVLLALAEEVVLMAREDGQVTLYDARSLEPLAGPHPAGSAPPRVATASADGRWFGVVFQNGRGWLYDAQEERTVRVPAGDWQAISALAFNDRQLRVALGVGRVADYRREEFQLERQLAPPRELLERVYYYLALPMYRVFPRPGELDTTIAALLADDDQTDLGEAEQPGGNDAPAVDPWRPLVNSLLFTLAMLSLCCAYMYGTDF